MLHRRAFLTVAVLVGALTAASSTLAARARVIPYAGVLDYNGAPYSGAAVLNFALFDCPSGTCSVAATQLWVASGSGTFPPAAAAGVVLTPNEGRFSVLLGDDGPQGMAALPDAAFRTSQLYVRIAVQASGGAWVPLTGYQRVAPVAAAVSAEEAGNFTVRSALTVQGPSALQGVTATTVAATTVAATGAVSGASLSTPGTINGASVGATGAVTSASVTTSGLQVNGAAGVTGVTTAGGSVFVTGLVDTTAGGNLGNAFVGDVGHGATWAGFSHESLKNTSSYSLLGSNGGETRLNSSLGSNMSFAHNNVVRMTMASDGKLTTYTGIAPGAEESLRIVRGTVNADGSVNKGAGFTVNRPSGGVFDITFSTAFSATPTLVCTANHPTQAANTSGSGFCMVNHPNSISASTVRVIISDGSAGNANFPFSFVAIGPK